ncbi:MAG TPA: hypothetical protein VMU48_05995 [Terracidiphilus sp.]|nr:hypothetical protein [Terracidiphilus sp.]
MREAMSFIFLAGLIGHLATYGFLAVVVPVVIAVIFDLRRASKAQAEKKNASMQFLAPYRDENGMPIFYEADEDPTERYAQRVLMQTRRAHASHTQGR